MSEELKMSTTLAHAIFDAIYDEDDLAEMKRKGVIAQELGYSLSVKAIIACELDLVDRLTQENQQLREALEKIQRMQSRTPELPEDYTHEDVGDLNDRIDEVFGIVNTTLSKLEAKYE